MQLTLHQRIKQIREIIEKEKLSVADVVNSVYDNGENISERTVYKLLQDTEENDLRFRASTVLTVYEALLSRFGDRSEIQDVATLKHIIVEQDKQIDRLVMQLEEMTKEYECRDKIYDDRKRVFESTIDLIKSQLAFKDDEIKTQATLIEKLINKVVE
jgi:Fe2+ or Zn2+ uptake regulation protein